MTSLASLASVVMSCAGPLPVELGWRIGGKKPFAQGWTHTGRLRRFCQKTVAGVVVVSFLDIEPH